MQNPFSPDYVAASVTDTLAPPNAAAAVTPTPQETGTTSAAANPLGPQTFSFAPQQYGLGKPKRVVIRGKISRE